MKVVPQAFYDHPAIKKVLVNGLSSIIYKQVSKPGLNNNRFLAAPALTLVRQGALQIETDTQQVYRVGDQEMVLLPKGLYLISDIIPKDQNFEAIVFFFEESLIHSFLEAFPDNDSNEQIASPQVFQQPQSLDLYIDTLLSLYADQTMNAQLTPIKLLELLHLIVASATGDLFLQSLYALDKRARKSVKHFMEANFEKPLSVEDYAFLTGRSISTFVRDFKRQFGLSPKKWLIEKRLAKAYEVLSNENRSITDTAFDVGYENLSHFIKAFHKRYGLSPKQYLIQNRKKLIV